MTDKEWWLDDETYYLLKCGKLEKKLEIAVKALKDALKDYEINGPCEEDCVGYYMYFIIRKVLKEMEEV